MVQTASSGESLCSPCAVDLKRYGTNHQHAFRSRFMLCGSSNRPLMSHRPGNFAYAIHNGDTGEPLAFKVASCVDCLSRSFPCDMDHGKWVNGKAREPVFYLPGKGEDVEPEWFPIPKAKSLRMSMTRMRCKCPVARSRHGPTDLNTSKRTSIVLQSEWTRLTRKARRGRQLQ
jgi:hypothetical protein